MLILTFTECAGIRATERGPRLVHCDVYRDSDTGDLFADESLTAVPAELRWPDSSDGGWSL